jgi:hypothetical protein
MTFEDRKRIEQHRALGALMRTERHAISACREASAMLDDPLLRRKADAYAEEHRERVKELKGLVDMEFVADDGAAPVELSATSDRSILRSIIAHEEAVLDECKSAWPLAHGPRRIQAVGRSFVRAKEQVAWLQKTLPRIAA